MKKRILSALSAILISTSALTAPMNAYASKSQLIEGSNKPIVVSINDTLTGYRDFTFDEQSIGNLIRRYYNLDGYQTISYMGYESDYVLEYAEKYDNIYDADIVIVSIGLSDYLLAAEEILSKSYPDLCEYGCPLSSIFNILNSVQNNEDALSKFIRVSASLEIAFSNVVAPVIKNVEKIRDTIKAKNPDCRIVFTTVYNPVLITEETLNQMLEGKPEYYSAGYSAIRSLFDNYITQFNVGLKFTEGIEIADLASAFTVPGSGGKYGYCDIYTDMLKGNKNELAPNLIGSIAAANTIIGTLGYDEKHGNESYLLDYYNQYPKERRHEFRKVLGMTLGDGDKSGVIDASDASMALMLYTQSQTDAKDDSTERKYAAIALDVDESGFTDASDASTILAHYADVQSGGKGIL